MIDPVSSVSVPGVGGASPTQRLQDTSAAEGFDDSIASALDGLGQAERRADQAALEGATGDLSSVSDYMVAATEAQLATEVTVAVRNRAIESFNEIMRMQI